MQMISFLTWIETLWSFGALGALELSFGLNFKPYTDGADGEESAAGEHSVFRALCCCFNWKQLIISTAGYADTSACGSHPQAYLYTYHSLYIYIYIYSWMWVGSTGAHWQMVFLIKGNKYVWVVAKERNNEKVYKKWNPKRCRTPPGINHKSHRHPQIYSILYICICM